MLEIKNSVPKMKNAFARLVSRFDTAEERISELEIISTETPKTEKQREQRLNENTHRKQNIQELRDNHKRYNIHNGNTSRRKEKKQKIYSK